ncbi:MAG: hypothetical protein ACXAEU_03205 [Candidatus Hodarchaeales archaeon]
MFRISAFLDSLLNNSSTSGLDKTYRANKPNMVPMGKLNTLMAAMTIVTYDLEVRYQIFSIRQLSNDNI